MIFTIKEDVYTSSVKVYMGEPFNKVQRFAGGGLSEPSRRANGTFWGTRDMPDGLIWFPRIRRACHMREIVYHECGHMAFHVMNAIGEWPRFGAGEETFLYLQSFYSEGILRRI